MNAILNAMYSILGKRLSRTDVLTFSVLYCYIWRQRKTRQVHATCNPWNNPMAFVYSRENSERLQLSSLAACAISTGMCHLYRHVPSLPTCAISTDMYHLYRPVLVIKLQVFERYLADERFYDIERWLLGHWSTWFRAVNTLYFYFRQITFKRSQAKDLSNHGSCVAVWLSWHTLIFCFEGGCCNFLVRCYHHFVSCDVRFDLSS